jgi:hypothetical protein
MNRRYRICDNTRNTECWEKERKWQLTTWIPDNGYVGGSSAVSIEYHSFDTKEEAEQYVIIRKLST